MIRALLALSVVIASVVTAPALAVAQDGSGAGAGIEVVVEPATVQTEVGVDFDLTARITNTGGSASVPLAVHIDVTSPTGSGSVDPEDWTSPLTRQLGALDPGETVTVDWTLKPISGGGFTAYVVALPESGDPDVWASNGVAVDVAERRTLNPEGVLPVAIGAPLVVGGLLVTRVRRSSRRR